MSISTKIQWCDSTCNPTMGCEGCELWNRKTGVRTCYAGQLHDRFGGATKGYSPTFEQLTFWPGRMAEATGWSDLTGGPRRDKPWLDGLPRLIFVSDMSDALSAAVPFEFLETEIIGNVTSADGRRHHWLWLTKRPDRMAQFSKTLLRKGVTWPTNLWAGTSLTTQATTPRIRSLLQVGDEGTIRFLSVEPQHERIDLSPWLRQLDWIIQGGESGRGACPFQLEWALGLIRQCREAKVPYFLKQLGSVVLRGGKRLTFEDGHAGEWSEWPAEMRVRQMPTGIGGSTSRTQSGTASAREPQQGHDRQAKRREAARKAWRTRRANERPG
jgi:protein gp37